MVASRLLPVTDRRYWAAWTAALLFFAGFYTLLIPMPLYLQAIGLSDWLIGLILGAFGVVSLVGRPVAGVLSDNQGPRPVILAGTLAMALGAALTPLTREPVLLLLLRTLQAGGYVLFTTAATALVAHLTPPAKLGAGMALFGVAANVAMTLVPAGVGGLLPRLTLVGAFWLCTGLALVGGLLVWRHVPDMARHPRRLTLADLVTVAAPLRLPMLTTWLFGASFGIFFQFMPLLADRRALGSAGLAYTVYGATIILTRLLTGRLLDRWGRLRPLLPAFLLTAGGLALLAWAAAPWHLWLGAVGIAAGSGILHPGLIALCVDRTPASQRGRATASFYLAFDLGIGLGSWLLSPVFEVVGLTGLFLGAAAIGLLGLVSGWVLLRGERGIAETQSTQR